MHKLLKNKTALACIIIIATITMLGIFAPCIAPYDPNETDIIDNLAPLSMEHLLGTDTLGRDIFSRLLYGVRTTLFYSFITMLVTALLGSTIGIASGYFKGKLDEIIMRACDIMLSFPYEVLVLSIVGVLGPGLMNIVFANIVAKSAWYIRLIRSETLSLTHKNYILYSQTIGTPKPYIFFRVLLPNVASSIILLATLDLGWIILSISTLSFLGLGAQPPTAEWGAMLNDAKETLLTNPEHMLIPGLAIMVVVAAFNMLGDALRDIFDPKEM